MSDDDTSNEYLYLEAGGLQFQVKFEDEGVILDVFHASDDEDADSITSAWYPYDDLPIRRKTEAEIAEEAS